jgi:hypothetical protein
MAKKYDINMVKSEDITDETLAQKGEEGFAPYLTINKRTVINSRLITEEYVIFIRTRNSGEETTQAASPKKPKGKGGRPPGSKNKKKIQ